MSGFDLLAGLLDLENRIKAADHVITGEGCIDHQSLGGKGPVALARLARSLSVPVTAFCGMADVEARNSGIFQSINALTDTGLTQETLIAQAGPLLTERVATSLSAPDVAPAAAPTASPSSGLRKISPINEPQKPPLMAPVVVRLMA